MSVSGSDTSAPRAVPNPARAALARGGIAVGTWLQLLSSARGAARLAATGVDFVYIDMQHTPFTDHTVNDLVVGVRLGGATPVVRPPSKDYPIERLLDNGTMGLLVPRVTTPQDVADVVATAKHPPIGQRIPRPDPVAAAARVACGLPAEDFANPDDPLIVIQIESVAALDRLDEILDVPGIDVVVVGRVDLSQDMGIPHDTANPRITAAVERVIAGCQARGIVPGLLAADAAAAIPWIERGIRWVPVGSDDRMLSAWTRQMLAGLADYRA